MTDPEDVYRRTTPGSRALHERAERAMPGGTTRTTTYFDPYPLYLDRGEGCRIWDVDGTERLDMLGNYTALILGHAHPKVVEAIHRQAERGTAFAAANPIEVELAELLGERVPSLDLVRFCNSGTEATMFAMRLARAFTGRPKIARIEGGYHGTHDQAEVSTHPDPAAAGPPDRPTAQPDSIGTPSWALEQTVVLPFNDADAAERILREEGDGVAAVILEPIIGAGGVIAATPEFLSRLRELTRELGMLLIFDEVISLRVAPGGAQQLYGVTSDARMTRDFFLGLVNHGILVAPRAMGALSTPMGEEEIQRFVDAVDEVVAEQLPRWKARGVGRAEALPSTAGRGDVPPWKEG